MLKTLVPKIRPDLSVRLKDIAEKQVLANLKLIVESIRLAKHNRAQCTDVRENTL